MNHATIPSSTADPFLVLTTPAPRISEARAATILSEHFGIEGELKGLTSERDTNFHVIAGDDEYVLKLANSAEDIGVTEFQNRALLHIALNDAELPVPRVVAATNGDRMISVQGDDGRVHTARLLTWIHGVPLEDADIDVSVARPLGRALARLGKALQGYEHLSSNYHLLWDLKRAARLRKLLPHVADPGVSDLCKGVLDRFESQVEPVLGDLRWQVIFNDLNPGNVLFDPGSPDEVAGIIDFGDMVYSPLIVDVAVACAYLVREDGDTLGDVELFLDAYTSVLPLGAEEVGVLYSLIILRMVATVLISNWRAAKYPENKDYLLRSEIRARGMLGSMHDGPSKSVAERINKACRIP